MRQKPDSRKAKYVLSREPIGEGGQAQVFEAHDRSTNAIVALKRVSSRDHEAISRMRREIEVQSTIKHPNVMPILDHSSQYRWYTMPLAEQSLGKLSLPLHDDGLLIEIVESCAKGLAAAHARGYVHRDLTPNNILQIRDQEGPRWVVSDWGLVRRHGHTTIARTLPGQSFGTLGFAPPEMWKDAHAVDARADVYSLGRVVAYCLTGEWPAPNSHLLPDGKWREFVKRMTAENVNQRVQNMQEVLCLLEDIKNSKYTEPSFSTSPATVIFPRPFAIDENQEIKLSKEPVYSPVRAKFIIAQRARETITALKERDFDKLTNLIHPIHGVRFSPYSAVSQDDLVILREQIRYALHDDTIHQWGYYDGIGTPIELTFRDYYNRFVYSKDFINADQVNYNEFSGLGNSPNNALQVYGDGIVVEFYSIGFDPQFDGMDWQSLQLAFQQFEDVWYLVGIIHGCWTT